jgi:hypothetical protein
MAVQFFVRIITNELFEVRPSTILMIGLPLEKGVETISAYMLSLHSFLLYLHLFICAFPALYSLRISATPGTTMRAMSYKRRNATLESLSPTRAAR